MWLKGSFHYQYLTLRMVLKTPHNYRERVGGGQMEMEGALSGVHGARSL